MDKIKLKNAILYILAILIILYVIWFITTHSEFVTFADLITVIGSIIALFSIVILISENRFGKLEGKIDELTKDMHYLKGRFNEVKK